MQSLNAQLNNTLSLIAFMPVTDPKSQLGSSKVLAFFQDLPNACEERANIAQRLLDIRRCFASMLSSPVTFAAPLERDRSLGSLSVLHDELVVMILKSLEPSELINVTLTSRALSLLAYNETVWEALVHREAPGCKLQEGGTWRELFKVITLATVAQSSEEMQYFFRTLDLPKVGSSRRLFAHWALALGAPDLMSSLVVEKSKHLNPNPLDYLRCWTYEHLRIPLSDICERSSCGLSLSSFAAKNWPLVLRRCRKDSEQFLHLLEHMARVDMFDPKWKRGPIYEERAYDLGLFAVTPITVSFVTQWLEAKDRSHPLLQALERGLQDNPELK